MKTNRTIVRIIAVLAVAAMLFSFAACEDKPNNPCAIKCGGTEISISQFQNIYNNFKQTYSQYDTTGSLDYKTMAINYLTNYGVQLEQARLSGIKLDKDEEAKVQEDVEEQIKSYLTSAYGSSIDSSITDEAEKYEAEMKLFEAALKSSNSNYKSYRSEVENEVRNAALINKLRDSIVGDITVNNDDVLKYFNDNYSTSTTLSSFNSAFSNFISGSSTSLPSYMPVIKAAEDTESESDSDAEATEPNPYDELFSVLHVLIKFETKAGDDVTDLAAYAAEDRTVSDKMEFVEQQLGSITADKFINDFCFNTDVCEDPGMETQANQYFGYLMAEGLISSYFEGFGNAAMMLKYPDWTPDTEEETEDASATEAPEPTEEPEPEVDHGYTPFTLSDGTQVMRVFTTTGVHYLILNPNDWNVMYNEEGKLQTVLYDGENPVMDGDSYVTVAGNISKEVFDAINEAFSHVGDPEAEGYVATTCKSVYDTLNSSALSSAQNEVYSAKCNEWMDQIKVTIKDSVIKAYLGV